MEEITMRETVVSAGLELLETGLVARTWGNVSCRADNGTMLISPSGLDYKKIRPEDIVPVNLSTGEWSGDRKPSGERGVHIAAYRCFGDVGFIIHTHQLCASALSLAGFENLPITDEEKEKLGGVALAAYGLPGTKKLIANVDAALRSGAKTILMAKHGVLICAADKNEAMKKAALLEEICRRGLKCDVTGGNKASDTTVSDAVQKVFPDTSLCASDALLYCGEKRMPVPIQLDDMAQMIDGRIPIAKTASAAVRLLKHRNAVLVPGVGAILRAEDPEDREALGILADKAAVCALHVKGCGKHSSVSPWDALLMHTVYKLKYSKQKR